MANPIGCTKRIVRASGEPSVRVVMQGEPDVLFLVRGPIEVVVRSLLDGDVAGSPREPVDPARAAVPRGTSALTHWVACRSRNPGGRASRRRGAAPGASSYEREAMSQTPERWADGPTIVQSIWRYRWLVLAITVAAGVAAHFISSAQPAVYQAAARMHLSNPATTGVFQEQPVGDIELYLPQQAQRIRSDRTLTAAADQLGEGVTPPAIEDTLEVSGDPALATLTVSVRDGSAERAADIANAVVAAYQEDVRNAQLQRVGQAVQELEASAADIEAQIDALSEDTTAQEAGDGGNVGTNQVASPTDVLTSRLVEVETLAQQLLVDARVFGSGVEVTEPAERPASPVSPTPRRTAAATALLAALLASAFAYWRAGRGGRIAGRDDPAQVLDAPLLGVLPTYKPQQQGTVAQRTSLDPRTTEAYRFVYSSLEATLRGQASRSVMVTSAGPGIGKSETSLQLATIAARRGQRVLLIDADLRMRGLTTFLRAERAPGLLDLAEPHSDPSIQHFPIDRRRHLDILTAGRATSVESSHLNESWFGAAFDELVGGYDLVVVDSPPVLAVADTTTIAGHTDAIVLVIREGANSDELDRMRQRLRFVHQRLVGYVYLTPSALDDTNFDYGLVRARAWQAAENAAGGSGKPTEGGWLPWQDVAGDGADPAGTGKRRSRGAGHHPTDRAS
jgi:Mrp family chromosome partitioning ATPase/capsular polysaccharide biosynthesis protein